MDNNSNVDNENIDESCYMFAQTVGGGRQLGRRQEEGDYIVILLSGLLGGWMDGLVVPVGLSSYCAIRGSIRLV